MLQNCVTSNARILSTLSARYITRRNVSVSSACCDHKWRREGSLPRNPNKSGPLTDLPDYTFMDGSVTPLGSNQKKRLLQQRELAQKIVTMSGEMDFAVDRYNRIQDEKARERQALLDSKLKPKGHRLLTK
uniref:Large ribosomal subunit protein mL52 n=1 Tax=Culex tarsalis TaxID=7177 RepID=A0A1Q3FBP3_CULTA